MSVSIIIVVAIVGIALVFVAVYNQLVGLRQNCNQAFADIDVQLKARQDLVPNLVETVKAYAAHERETLDAVIQARNQAVGARGSGGHSQAEAEGAFSAALGRLAVVAEAYPELKANTNFQQLMGDLSDLENKIAAARRFFNHAVSEYNTGIQQFPAVLMARPMGFAEMEFFDVGEDTRIAIDSAPQVKF